MSAVSANAGARPQRIAAQLQRSLAQLLQRGVKDPRVGNVTVTAVLLAADLSVATVYVVPFGGPAAAGAAAAGMLEGLRSAAGFLRGELARELRLRHAPRLSFELDRQLEQAHRLTELIDQAVAGDADRAGGSTPGGSSH
ncbi:MAG TPA: 30S ribosome-binding factor RbfA [Steroidobacteraceae bacterium]|nr:30S ribosome-binding factor RbfA [Steroidobacteraceae bacterium]